jgi:hypothetical protein
VTVAFDDAMAARSESAPPSFVLVTVKVAASAAAAALSATVATRTAAVARLLGLRTVMRDLRV